MSIEKTIKKVAPYALLIGVGYLLMKGATGAIDQYEPYKPKVACRGGFCKTGVLQG